MKPQPYIIKPSMLAKEPLSRGDAAGVLRGWRRQLRRVHIERLWGLGRICYSHGDTTVLVPMLF